MIIIMKFFYDTYLSKFIFVATKRFQVTGYTLINCT